MTFLEVFPLLKCGLRITRESWMDSQLVLIKGKIYAVSLDKRSVSDFLAELHKTMSYEEYMTFHERFDYRLSSDDLLAENWKLLEDSRK